MRERTIFIRRQVSPTCHKPGVMTDPGSTTSPPGPARANNNNNNNVEDKKQNRTQQQNANAQTAIVLGRWEGRYLVNIIWTGHGPLIIGQREGERELRYIAL